MCNSVKMKRGAGLTLGPVTPISRHSEQLCKVKIEKAHITPKSRCSEPTAACTAFLSLVFPTQVRRAPDRGQGARSEGSLGAPPTLILGSMGIGKGYKIP